MQITPDRFLDHILQNRVNRAVLERLPELGLPDAWLVAGCLFQTVWNLQAGRAPDASIKDYDLFYFDAADLSPEGEAAVQARVDALFGDLGVMLEAKNQARVHTWYPTYFGHPYSALGNSQEGMERFLVLCTCVGVRPRPDSRGAEPLAAPSLELHAPDGLDDLYAGVLRPNPACDHADLFAAKVRSYQARWPGLRLA